MSFLTSRRGVLVGLVLLVLLVIFVLFPRDYGTLSPRGYSHAMSLASICNRKDAAKALQLQEMLHSDLKNQALTATEGRWLQAILNRALAGEWTTSASQVRQLMEAQIRPAAPLP